MSDLHPTAVLFSFRERKTSGKKGGTEKWKGVADTLKLPHSIFWRFSVINLKAARAGAELWGGKAYILVKIERQEPSFFVRRMEAVG